ncbi:DNA repair protein [Pararobbsia alpina]
MKPNMRFEYLAAVAISLACVAGHASAQSIEERLRSQLRSTTDQLHQAQDSQAQMQTQLTQAQQDRDKAQADLKAAQGEAAKAKPSEDDGARRALAAEKVAHDKDRAELEKMRRANDELQKTVRSRDVDLAQVRDQLKASGKQVEVCTAKNKQLYDVGHEILDAYEHIDLETVLKTREPFAQSARVKYDEIAQDYGDKLYGAKFDPRMSATAAASTPAAAAPAAPASVAGASH